MREKKKEREEEREKTVLRESLPMCLSRLLSLSLLPLSIYTCSCGFTNMCVMYAHNHVLMYACVYVHGKYACVHLCDTHTHMHVGGGIID